MHKNTHEPGFFGNDFKVIFFKFSFTNVNSLLNFFYMKIFFGKVKQQFGNFIYF